MGKNKKEEIEIVETINTIITIWLAIYILSSLVFSFYTVQFVRTIAFIVMMISCLRIPSCIRNYNVTNGATIADKTTKPLLLLYLLCGVGICTGIYKVISF
jgi:hypothetical protein